MFTIINVEHVNLCFVARFRPIFDALVQFSNFQTIKPQQQNKTKHEDAAIFEGFLRVL
jgi:hypothetical protein